MIEIKEKRAKRTEATSKIRSSADERTSGSFPNKRAAKLHVISHKTANPMARAHRAALGPIARHDGLVPYGQITPSAFDEYSEKVAYHDGARSGRSRKMIAVSLLAVTPVALCVYAYEVRSRTSYQSDLDSLFAQVRSSVAISATATPEVYLVSDPRALSQKGGVYAHLKSGDRVLYYKESRMVVLYSSGEHKILAVMPSGESGSLVAK